MATLWHCYKNWFSGLALVAVGLIALGCAEAAKRRFFSSCASAVDCESGVCFQSVCSKPCTTSAQCGGGICVENLCVPADKVACKQDAQCASLLAAGPCQAPTCTASVCKLAVKSDGASCGDDLCVAAKVCSGGQCAAKAGAPTPQCSDGNTCTHDQCTPGTGCAFVALSGPCDDGDACTISDACANSACVAGMLKACDDGNSCTVGDACVKGACVGGIGKVCDDNNACTVDSCAASGQCALVTVSGGSLCDDGNACTAQDTCVGAKCTPGAAKACDDLNPCTSDSCAGGTCSALALPPGSVCDDGNQCTGSGTCQSGSCTKGEAMVWNLAAPIAAGSPMVAVGADTRDGQAHFLGYHKNGVGKQQIVRTTYSTSGALVGEISLPNADYNLLAADAVWLQGGSKKGVHLVVGLADKTGTPNRAFVAALPLGGLGPNEVVLLTDTLSPGSPKPFAATAVAVVGTSYWLAGIYETAVGGRPWTAKLGANYQSTAQAVHAESTDPMVSYVVNAAAVVAPGIDLVIVGKSTSSGVVSGFIRKITDEKTQGFGGTPAPATEWFDIAPHPAGYVLAGTKKLANGMSKGVVALLTAAGKFSWQHDLDVGAQTSALAVVASSTGSSVYVAGWSMIEAGKATAPVVARFDAFSNQLDFSVFEQATPGLLRAIALRADDTALFSVGTHSDATPGVAAALAISANAFAQVLCVDTGSCTGKAASACDDGIACTFDTCTQSACTHNAMPEGTPCSVTGTCLKTEVCSP